MRAHSGNKTLALLDWENLRLTQDETKAIALLRGCAIESAAHCLHQRPGGWAAGLTVLMEDAENRETAPVALDSASPQALFDYSRRKSSIVRRPSCGIYGCEPPVSRGSARPWRGK